MLDEARAKIVALADAERDEVIEAATAAFVDRFVHTLPDGYETRLNDGGANISAGEKQLITIARAVLARPQLLILDEPTAGIDIGSKSEIIRLVRDLAQAGKGVIVISSELSELLTACDRILVMADGRAHQMLDRADLDDPSETNPEHALQAAERRLQVEIQKALTVKEASHG